MSKEILSQNLKLGLKYSVNYQ